MKQEKPFNPVEHFKNKLIVVEGPDFSTKTTFIKLLSAYLDGLGIEHTKTFQPGDTSYGEEAKLIRELTKREDMSEKSSLFLYLYDRIQNNSKIVKPALDAGKTVISDRWWYSTMAYQWSLPEIQSHFSWDDMVKINKFACGRLNPNISLYLMRHSVDIMTQVRKEVDKYDRLDVLRKIKISAVYEKLFNQGKLKKVFVIENKPEETFKSFLKMEEENAIVSKVREDMTPKEVLQYTKQMNFS